MKPGQLVIVDDDPVYLEMIAEALSDGGYDVTTSVSGSQSLETIACLRPRLVMLDVHLFQQHSGWSLLKRLRENAQTANIPVLICSTDPWLLVENASWLQSQGCETLEKPFGLDELECKISSMTGEPAPN